MRLIRLRLVNFLSYRDATLELGDLVALVGQNAAGKSNVLKALKLLRDIPIYGLQTAVSRRGGYDQLRHRSEGRPFDPSIRIEFQTDVALQSSFYELRFRSLSGKRYEVKSEEAEVWTSRGMTSFVHKKNRVRLGGDESIFAEAPGGDGEIPVPSGQSALSLYLGYGGYDLWQFLQGLQPLEISPALVGELQDVTSTRDLFPDGSNVASVYELLETKHRQALVAELAAIVPGLTRVEVSHFSDKVTLRFGQEHGGTVREFMAKQMSDGTLRTFGILLAFHVPYRQNVVIIEEPETAIHLGALTSLVEILQAHSEDVQILLTTHSADIIDHLPPEDLRLVWSENGASHIRPIAAHTLESIRSGLIGAGRLLKAGALDPETS